jgi:hypothetical protein
MSTSLVRYAVATAIAAAAAGAASAATTSPIPITLFNSNAANNITVYISGSTAVDNTINGVLSTASLNICQGTVYEDEDSHKVLNASGAAIGGAIEYWYYCQAGTSSGVATTKWLSIFKESTAGSINGAQPLIAVAQSQATNLTYLSASGPDVIAGTCANALVSSGTDAGCTSGDFSQNVTPTGGVADVEATLLRTIPGAGTLSTAQISQYLSGAPGLDVVWGIDLTKNFFYALQTAEHLEDGTVIAACNGGTSVDLPQCAPSLSKEQIASVLLAENNANGNLTFWNQIVGISNSADNNVYICRRDVGSGTEASFEAYFLGARCSSSDEAMANQDGQFTIESASTGNILRCLEGFDNGSVNITPYNGDFLTNYQPFTPAGNQWAIGITSTELTSAQLTSFGDTLRMVAVDGVLPTLANVVNGYYPYFSTDQFYTVKSGFNGSPSGTPPGSVFAAIQAVIGHPIEDKAVDANYSGRPWGSGGDLAPASLFATSSNAGYTAWPVTTAAVLANPINVFTKASNGSVNNCDTPVLYGSLAGAGNTQQTAAEANLHGSNGVNN